MRNITRQNNTCSIQNHNYEEKIFEIPYKTKSYIISIYFVNNNIHIYGPFSKSTVVEGEGVLFITIHLLSGSDKENAGQRGLADLYKKSVCLQCEQSDH